MGGAPVQPAPPQASYPHRAGTKPYARSETGVWALVCPCPGASWHWQGLQGPRQPFGCTRHRGWAGPCCVGGRAPSPTYRDRHRLPRQPSLPSVPRRGLVPVHSCTRARSQPGWGQGAAPTAAPRAVGPAPRAAGVFRALLGCSCGAGVGVAGLALKLSCSSLLHAPGRCEHMAPTTCPMQENARAGPAPRPWLRGPRLGPHTTSR